MAAGVAGAAPPGIVMSEGAGVVGAVGLIEAFIEVIPPTILSQRPLGTYIQKFGSASTTDLLQVTELGVGSQSFCPALAIP